MAHMNKSVTDYTPKTYADSGGRECKVDCSLGVNLDPLPEQVLERLKNLPSDLLKHYPHGEEVFDSLLEKLRKLNPTLTRKNISLGCGSVNVLINLNSIFINEHKRALGYAPQFSSYVDDVHFKGAEYVGVPLKKEDNYKINVAAVCDYILKYKPDLVYLDNPNNPTGQILSVDELKVIHAAADSIDAALIVDEAYGDYMPAANSMISEVNKLNGLVVVKTMSKGYGMAGMRMGYAVASEDIIEQLDKVMVQFNCGSFARVFAVETLAIDDESRWEELRALTAYKGQRIRAALSGKLKMAHSYDSVPISLIYSEDESVDLAKLFASVGISAVSGASFDNLSFNSVRLSVPPEKDVELLCELLKEAERKL